MERVMSKRERMVVVANRLPVSVDQRQAIPTVRPSSGGLVSALAPVLRRHAGCWVGWYGCPKNLAVEEYIRTDDSHGFALQPVGLSDTDIHRFYEGYSNQSIWPVFHEVHVPSSFDADQWYANSEINDVFAEATAMVARNDDFVWVHDYHLMLQAEALQERGVRARIGYFHHIPFPAPDTFAKLPWRRELLRALMAFHLLGFQTRRDQRNFVACIKRHFSDFSIRRIGSQFLVEAAGRCVTVGTFPVGIDTQAMAAPATTPEVQQRAALIRNSYPGCKIMLSVDRLDYTKGSVERLLAVEELLERHPQWIGQTVLLQLTVPSRDTIPQYAAIKCEIERQVSRINGRFGRPGWMPIQYLYRSVERNELVAMYAAADIAVVSPLRDGMNLVAKEFCAARTSNTGVLVLSEFAGAAEQLAPWAMLINPFDTEQFASALDKAMRCDARDQQVRMERMRNVIDKHDVFHWSKTFCAAGIGVQLRNKASSVELAAASAA
jgi:alpha,alpha-trehalose-phosphate synthase [UDP-forming]